MVGCRAAQDILLPPSSRDIERLESHVALGIAHLQEAVTHPHRHSSDVARVGPARAEIGQGLDPVAETGRAHLGDKRGHGWVGLLALGGLALEPADRLAVLLARRRGGHDPLQELEQVGELLHVAGRLSRSFEVDRQQAQGPCRLDVLESLGHEDGLVERQPWLETVQGCPEDGGVGFPDADVGGQGHSHLQRSEKGVQARRRQLLEILLSERPHLGRVARHLPVRHQTGKDGQALRVANVAQRVEQSGGSRQRPVGLLIQQGVAQVEQHRARHLRRLLATVRLGRRFAASARISSKRNPARLFLRLGLGRIPRRTNTSRIASTLRPSLSC